MTYDRRTAAERAPEITRAIKAIQDAITALHDCAPNAKEFRERGDDGFSKAVVEHGKRIEALREILFDLNAMTKS